MSWIQAQEELAYDTQTEYLAVLRADHYDPEDHFWYCEAHGATLARTEDCPDCPAYVPAPLPVWEGEEPPF